MIRPALPHDDLITLAVDGSVTGLSSQRAREIIDVALSEDDCLVHVDATGNADGFAIMNRRAFFGRDFIKLVVVAPHTRRDGVGSSLVAAALARATTDKVFISTNESNVAMRALLIRDGWTLSGTLDGIDEGDPEMVFWNTGAAPS